MLSLLTRRNPGRPRQAGYLALLTATALATPLFAAAPSASAGDVNWRVTIGNHGGHSHYHRGHHRSGYYKSVWRPPVYQTHYDDCGRPVRVCVRRGYYDRVWVSAPKRKYSYGSHHYPRHQRYDRYRRGGCW